MSIPIFQNHSYNLLRLKIVISGSGYFSYLPKPENCQKTTLTLNILLFHDQKQEIQVSCTYQVNLKIFHAKIHGLQHVLLSGFYCLIETALPAVLNNLSLDISAASISIKSCACGNKTRTYFYSPVTMRMSSFWEK